jgi:ATP-dependent 26S proteasome regulatory subunit
MSIDTSVRPGERLGDFEIQRLLGRGGFKTVYAARNLAAAANGWPQQVAVCVPHAQDEEARELLRNELRVVQTLDHPGIVRESGLIEARGRLFAVMELVRGRTLSEVLREQGPLPLDQVVDIMRQAGEALDYAHEGLAIHRDIKPGNLMLSDDGTVKVLDFGLARLMAHSQYRASTRVGSVAYMAPEQFEGSAGLNADLWGLGVTLYQLLTNTLPFPARDEGSLLRQILYEAPDLSGLDTGDFDPRLGRVLAKVLQKDPERRYQRAAELLADLRAAQRHGALVNQVEGQIEVHLRAHFPLLCLQTFEEGRVLASLRQVRAAMSEKRPIGLYIWSASTGLCDDEGNLVHGRTLGDPLHALEQVFQGREEAIYVFLDMHRHFTPVSVRLIRDAVWTVKRARKSLVFVGPSPEIPEELASDATLLFYPPPMLQELEDLLARVAEQTGVPAPVGPLREQLAQALLGLTEREAERVLRRAVLRRGALEQAAAEVLREKEQTVRKEGVLEFWRPELSFDDVGGLTRLKDWFAKRRRAFEAAGRRFGLRPPRGVVLAGVPGCGKSLSAKALAADWGVPLLRLDLGRIYASLLGESEGRLRRALATAEAMSPCILWIDELEKAFSGLGQGRDNGVARRVFGSFLTWLEDRQAPVFVAATANDIQRLPKELTRKGRFDELFFVDLPDTEARRGIAAIHIQRRRRDPKSFDLAALAEASEGCSGAEIEAAVVGGLYRAFADGARELTDADIRAALGESPPLARSRAKDIERLRRWAAEHARAA